jgi:RTX calcium-binding nonapeptide repeat (4 copies)
MSRPLSVLLSAVALLGCAAAPAPAAPRIGTPGDDTLTGTGARDVLEARGGDDDAYGAAGRDVVSAGPGSDQLLGGRGGDVLAAGSGADQVHADDGLADVVSCGPGLDTYFADRRDRVGADCERNGRLLLRGGALATFDVVGERFRA